MSKKKKKLFIIGIVIVFFMVLLGTFFFYRRYTSYVIRQIQDSTGNQAMFYIVQSRKGGIIVVDGGNEGNAQYTREVLGMFGNHVDAWILTHPHPDHIAVFNEIYAEPQGIQIDEIYATPLDYDVYSQYAQPYDQVQVYEKFLALTENAENIHYLHEGDTLELIGLKMEVFNAYDENTIHYSLDLCNNGSLVFRLSGKENSMLFCGDVYGDSTCNKILERHGDALKSDYIQMGHHGNNSVTERFIEAVQPKLAFFDAPKWLVEGEKYDTQKNIEMVLRHGAKYRTYETAPNKVIMH